MSRKQVSWGVSITGEEFTLDKAFPFWVYVVSQASRVLPSPLRSSPRKGLCLAWHMSGDAPGPATPGILPCLHDTELGLLCGNPALSLLLGKLPCLSMLMKISSHLAITIYFPVTISIGIYEEEKLKVCTSIIIIQMQILYFLFWVLRVILLLPLCKILIFQYQVIISFIYQTDNC